MAIQFWKDREKKELNENLFSSVAEEEAKKVFYDPNIKSKMTQIRRFFDEIITFDARCKLALNKASSDRDREAIFRQHLPFIHMLIPKVKYAEARKLVSSSFTAIIKSVILENLKESGDIKIMSSFFEAFIGHYKYFVEIEGNNIGGRR